MSQVLRAPAKVNIFLEVGKRNGRGYHEVRTLMVLVDIWDEMELLVTDGDGFHLESTVPLPEKNTLLRAYEEFSRETGIRFGLEIFLNKRIPPGSGLGGGSSDAAALLLYLNERFGYPLSLEKLLNLSSRIGMDVPFFIHKRPSLMGGKGDTLLRYVDFLESFEFVIVWPAVEVKTESVYNEFDRVSQPRDQFRRDISSVRDLDELVALVGNDLERPFLSLYPELSRVKEFLAGYGALAVSLTGSGSSFFGVFDGLSDVDSLRDAAKNCGWEVFKVKALV